MSSTYGCHSKHKHERHIWYLVQDGWTTDGKRKMVGHNDTSTRECQYRKGMPDHPRCKGCACL